METGPKSVSSETLGRSEEPERSAQTNQRDIHPPLTSETEPEYDVMEDVSEFAQSTILENLKNPTNFQTILTLAENAGTPTPTEQKIINHTLINKIPKSFPNCRTIERTLLLTKDNISHINSEFISKLEKENNRLRPNAFTKIFKKEEFDSSKRVDDLLRQKRSEISRKKQAEEQALKKELEEQKALQKALQEAQNKTDAEAQLLMQMQTQTPEQIQALEKAEENERAILQQTTQFFFRKATNPSKIPYGFTGSSATEPSPNKPVYPTTKNRLGDLITKDSESNIIRKFKPPKPVSREETIKKIEDVLQYDPAKMTPKEAYKSLTFIQKLQIELASLQGEDVEPFKTDLNNKLIVLNRKASGFKNPKKWGHFP